MDLPAPFDTFRLEKKAGEYKDFGVSPDSSYPLRGVTYPVDYGDIAGYIGEDGANLDVFLGHRGNIHGFIKVYRPELPAGEHKFYAWLTEQEEAWLIEEFKPVIVESGRFATLDELLRAIQHFKEG